MNYWVGCGSSPDLREALFRFVAEQTTNAETVILGHVGGDVEIVSFYDAEQELIGSMTLADDGFVHIS